MRLVILGIWGLTRLTPVSRCVGGMFTAELYRL